MKYFLVFCILVASWHATQAQIRGRVLRFNGEPAALASVFLLHAVDSALITGSLTSEQGRFQFESVAACPCIVRVSGAGFNAWFSGAINSTISSAEVNLGDITLRDSASTLGEVVIRASKPFFQAVTGGMAVNVESSLVSKGSTLLAVLERSPGVMLDRRNNDVSLNGKTGVLVMINGKSINMSMDQVFALLESMSADDVEKIELLTTPPANYDAQGAAGVINIVLKRNRRLGTHGNLGITAGYGIGEKLTANASLAHKTRKLNLFASYTVTHNRNYGDLFGMSHQVFPPLGGYVEVYFQNYNRNIENNHNVSLAVDAAINSRTTIGGSVVFISRMTDFRTVNDRVIKILPDSLSNFTATINGSGHSQNLIASGYLEQKLGLHEKLNIEADYISFVNSIPTSAISRFYDSAGRPISLNDTFFAPTQRGYSNTRIEVGVLRADYNSQLLPGLSLDAGAKVTLTKNNSQSDIESLVNGDWISRQETGNATVMNEFIGAAYVTVNKQFNAKNNLVLGLRYEYAQTETRDRNSGKQLLDRQGGFFFPNLIFTHNMSEAVNWQLIYSKRISRPSYNDLLSYIIYNDPLSVITGNPFLQPTISHTLKTALNTHGYAWSLSFSHDLHPIARWQITESAARDLQYIGPQNLDWQNALNAQFSKSWKIYSWWSFNLDLLAGWRQFREHYTRYPLQKSWFGYSGNFLQTFLLPKQFAVELSGFYNGPSYNGTVSERPYGSVNAGLKKTFGSGRGSLQFSVTDVFSTIRYRPHYGELTEEAFSGGSEVTVNPESRHTPIFRLSYSRSFGLSSSKTAQPRSGTGDEQDRIR